MKGEYAFCPKSGARLSEEIHYDEFGRGLRTPVRDDHTAGTEPDGELTNGSHRSSRVALFNHFRRCHEQHGDSSCELYSKTALALTRLKRTASDHQSWDMYVWFALGQRLADLGNEVQWMNSHVEPRCPDCAGRLKYDATVDGTLSARCGTDCTGSGSDKLEEIRETVADLYVRAFEDATRPDAFALL